jgi:hypothetical protein
MVFKQPERTTEKEISVMITFHCMKRMRERLTFLADLSADDIIAKMNEQLRSGFIKHNSKTDSIMLGFEGVGFAFIIKPDTDCYSAVTFKHKLKPFDNGKPVKVSYFKR